VTYLIVGLDKHNLVPWHDNICAGDAATAKRTAHARALAQGIHLVVAAVIGPNLAVLSDREDERVSSHKAA
jgi:glycerol-3-phosphate dehydrogenase